MEPLGTDSLLIRKRGTKTKDVDYYSLVVLIDHLTEPLQKMNGWESGTNKDWLLYPRKVCGQVTFTVSVHYCDIIGYSYLLPRRGLYRIANIDRLHFSSSYASN